MIGINRQLALLLCTSVSLNAVSQGAVSSDSALGGDGTIDSAIGAKASELVARGDGQLTAGSPTKRSIFNFRYNTSGGFPAAGVIADSHGNLYGTAGAGGGGADDGLVFELSPPSGSEHEWVETVLYRFSGGTDGSTPDAGLTLDPKTGILYGTAEYVLGTDTGVVFELLPPSAAGGGWTYRVIHAFSGGDGGVPQTELILTSSGALLGATSLGGNYDSGTVFSLQPPTGQSSDWTYTILHQFNPSTDGNVPAGPIAVDERGDIFGMTSLGGANGQGTVYEVSPPRESGQAWGFRVIYELSDANGAQSFTGLVRRPSDGSLFGATLFGGASNLGVVFQLTPPSVVGGAFTPTTLYSFTGNQDGCNAAAIGVSKDGSLYGTTSGLECPNGSVFQLSKPTTSSSQWTFSSLAGDPLDPIGPLLIGNDKIYGTDYFGGAAEQGSVYVLTF